MSDSELYKYKQQEQDSEEARYLEDKKSQKGWTQRDADRYAMLTGKQRLTTGDNANVK